MKYSAALWMMSVSAAAVLSQILCRCGRRMGIYSAALGIILYRIVKSIFVECGWCLAAFAGSAVGFVLEASVMCWIMLLFRGRDRKGRGMHSYVGVTMTCAGEMLMWNSALSPSLAASLVCRSLQLAMLASAADFTLSYGFNLRREEESGGLPLGFSLVSLTASFGLMLAVRCVTGNAVEPAAPLIIMPGVCALLYLFAGCVKESPELSAGGFAAGLLLSYGFDCAAW